MWKHGRKVKDGSASLQELSGFGGGSLGGSDRAASGGRPAAYVSHVCSHLYMSQDSWRGFNSPIL